MDRSEKTDIFKVLLLNLLEKLDKLILRISRRLSIAAHPNLRGKCLSNHINQKSTREFTLTPPNVSKVSRRGFIGATGATTLAASAIAHPAIGSVKGANDKVNVAIIGPGGRAQSGGFGRAVFRR